MTTLTPAYALYSLNYGNDATCSPSDVYYATWGESGGCSSGPGKQTANIYTYIKNAIMSINMYIRAFVKVHKYMYVCMSCMSCISCIFFIKFRIHVYLSYLIYIFWFSFYDTNSFSFLGYSYQQFCTKNGTTAHVSYY